MNLSTIFKFVYSLGNAYSALAVSDNGNFVATGTMSEVRRASLNLCLLTVNCREWWRSSLHLT